MAGWNFFFFEALVISFEITAMTFLSSFWSERVAEPGPTAAICAGCIIIYGLLNMVAVKVYGESEFCLSSGKIILLLMLFAFTFITMGFLACLYTAAFTIVGPEYISMAAAEVKHPSIYVKEAYKTVYDGLCFFFVVGALAVSVVVLYDNPNLRDLWFGTGTGIGSAAGSPYVLAMSILGINDLPHIVNTLILTSIFSAGNTYCFCLCRVLHGLALEGRAPKILAHTTKSGTPIYAFGIVLCFACLSFLQVSSGTTTVLSWMTSLITGGGQINSIVMTVTLLRYHKASSVQGVDRKIRPYYGRFQPYSAWLAIGMQIFICLSLGYTSFLPWDVDSFFAGYTMRIPMPVLFIT
ncbi:unnamed protein product [Clonostachys rhizophaga]|uniref:Amino acid permease/ SLC12A domain-containing protein n=1 Tax=Clonostachys rhizophaga TaxID=160324 RepID=A0A9N9YUG1_9HYPO|nr:unnamed protein product [Clonostachys rhizophaga]